MTKKQSLPQRRLGLERLDARLCLSATPIFENGVLTVRGSQSDDSILVQDNGRGLVVVQDIATGQRTPFRGVQQIVIQAGTGNDTISFTRRGAETALPDLDIAAGGGDDSILIGLLLPAVQKVREAAARMKVDLGRDNDRLTFTSSGVDRLDLDIIAGEGNDDVHVGLLVPAVQKVREAAARMNVDLGGGNDRLRTVAMGIDQLDLDLVAGGGDDDVAIGLLLPAVQKVREAAARMNLDLGEGNDHLDLTTVSLDQLDLDLSAGGGDDNVAIGLLLPAVQKVREAAARMNVNLDEGNDRFTLSAYQLDQLDLAFTAGAGDDDVAIGLLLPAVQKVRAAAARMNIDLGEGNDDLDLVGMGVDHVELDVLAGSGDDEINIGLLLPAVRPILGTSARVKVDLVPGADKLRLRTRAYESLSTEVISDADDTVDVPR